MESRLRPLLVTAAIIEQENYVLIAQRLSSSRFGANQWEFPGGKVEPGERLEQSLIRELKEELDIDVTEACLAPFTFASHVYDDFYLLMPLFVCRVWQGMPRPVEEQALKWMRPLRMAELPMPPADRPLAAMLRDLL